MSVFSAVIQRSQQLAGWVNEARELVLWAMPPECDFCAWCSCYWEEDDLRHGHADDCEAWEFLTKIQGPAFAAVPKAGAEPDGA